MNFVTLPEKPGLLKGLRNPFAGGKGAPLARLLILVVLFALAFPLYAQNTTVTDDEVNAIAKRMYCPVCENIPLDVCPTAACAQWRGEIRTQLEAGRTPEQIIDDFVQRFGERVIGTPQDPTLRALSLATPWVIGILAIGVGVYTLLRWRSSRLAGSQATLSAATTPGAALLSDDEYRARLERDLQARR